MIGLINVKVISIIISAIAIGATIYMWYQVQDTNNKLSKCNAGTCVQKYNGIIDKTGPTPVYYTPFYKTGNNKLITTDANGTDPSLQGYTPMMIGVIKSETPPTEGFIPNLTNVYQKERFSTCSSGKCNSRQNEWGNLAGKTCTSPNCSEHFNPRNFGLYEEKSGDNINYIQPENFHPTIKSGTTKSEYYTDVSTNGIPRVDMKDRLRTGSDIIRGDIEIVPTGKPIVGASKLRHESLTPALFY
jgi:hypothetical protein